MSDDYNTMIKTLKRSNENPLNPLLVKHNNKDIDKCMYSQFLMAFNAQQDHRANTGIGRMNLGYLRLSHFLVSTSSKKI